MDIEQNQAEEERQERDRNLIYSYDDALVKVGMKKCMLCEQVVAAASQMLSLYTVMVVTAKHKQIHCVANNKVKLHDLPQQSICETQAICCLSINVIGQIQF